MRTTLLFCCAIAGAIAGCTGPAGAPGADGTDGTNGTDGRDGTDGTDGMDGADGMNGADGMDGMNGADGMDGADGIDGMDGMDGRDADDASSDIPTFVAGLVDEVAAGTLPATTVFPLEARATDRDRAIAGLRENVVISWLEPLTFNDGVAAPRFGGNPDYVAYFGDGWSATAGDAPQFHGSGTAGWIWVNHEYVSNTPPALTAAPSGQQLTLATFLRERGVLSIDPVSSTWDQASVDTFVTHWRRQLGGSWMRIVQDPSTRRWTLDRSEANLRYDATSATLARITGLAGVSADQADDGTALPADVATGILADCSGGQTPWGTIVTAEENAQGAYGDMELCWSSSNRFVTGQGCDPGATITFTRTPLSGAATSELGRTSNPNARHARDLYGYLVEIDPGAAPSEYYGRTSAGVGHRKLGAIGRARWENTTFATDGDFELVAGQPIVMYMSDDRRSGRIFRFVSSAPYTAGMTRAQIRALLDAGTLYVAHFTDLSNDGFTLAAGGMAPTEAARGNGRWVEISLTSTDLAPNAMALGMPAQTVGAALASTSWNGIGGFATDDDVRRALFTAANKIGVRELNRPEDLEWSPRDRSGTPRLYVAFTNNSGQRALDGAGVLVPPAMHATAAFNPNDRLGGIVALEESSPATPGTSDTFTFWVVARGTSGEGPYDFANPDNLVVDGYGGVWFGTDGNFGTNGHADAVYYLDLDPAHRTTATPTYGRAFRVVAVASDAEATGPALSSDQRTLFLSVQHPGEDVWSTWPDGAIRDRPRPALVALTRGH